jgi:DNA-binding transcriptional LysR family regulator
MNVNFELYRIFYVVATCGNITKASQELMISQPAVTKQIKTLENQLGGELFIRTKRGVILTENGKEIYNYIKQGMNCFNNAELQFSNLKKLETGIIRVGVSTTLARLFLIDYLDKFHKEYPNVAIQVFTDPSRIMRNMLKDGTIDLLVAKEEISEDEDLEVQRIGKLHQGFVASNYFSELKGKKIKLQDLENYPILLPKSPSTTRESFDDFCKRNNIEITTKLEIASASLLEDFARIGLGVGLVTMEFATKDIEEGKLFEVKIEPELPSKYFSLITLKDSHHSFGANKLMEMIMNDVNKKDLR